MTWSDRIGAKPVQSSGSYRAWDLPSPSPMVVDMAWYSRSDHRDPERHRLLPFTEPSIALRRRFTTTQDTSAWDLVIFRAQPDGGEYVPDCGEELFALRLAPEAMESGLKLSPKEHVRQDRELSAPLLDRFDCVRHLADLGDFHAAWKAMFDALQQVSIDVEIDRIDRAAALARKSRGALAPGALAERAGVSARHMRRGFQDRLGISPRALLRRQRLTAAMLAAERLHQPGWADIAVAHGFADQSHMIRECRSLVGTSPSDLHRQRRAMAVSFNTSTAGAAIPPVD